MNATNAKHLQTLANQIVDGFSRDEVKAVAANGFTGELPECLDADDAIDLREAVQNTAVCIAAGAVRS